MSIGENIRRLRLARGMSQTELAEKLGVSTSYTFTASDNMAQMHGIA